jgi:sensor histidine kinase YesM
MNSKQTINIDEKINFHRNWWILILIWFILTATSINRILTYANEGSSLSTIILINVIRWTIVVLFGFVFYKIAQVLKGRAYSIPVHFLLSLLFVPLLSLLFTLPGYLIFDGFNIDGSQYIQSSLFNFRWLIMVVPIFYGLTVAYYYYKKNYEEYTTEKVREKQMEMDLIEAKLAVFRSQLDPHFLFNTLQGITTLIGQDKNKAKETLGYLRQILEMMKERKDVMKVELQQEMEVVNYYLKIEKTRYQDVLRIEQHIAEDTLRVLIPTFSIQLLVENAIKHGISKSSEPGLIKISSRKNENRLNVSIENSAKTLNFDKITENSNGIGLSNIRSRLERMYDDSTFAISKSELGGLKVQFSIPVETGKKR